MFPSPFAVLIPSDGKLLNTLFLITIPIPILITITITIIITMANKTQELSSLLVIFAFLLNGTFQSSARSSTNDVPCLCVVPVLNYPPFRFIPQ